MTVRLTKYSKVIEALRQAAYTVLAEAEDEGEVVVYDSEDDEAASPEAEEGSSSDDEGEVVVYDSEDGSDAGEPAEAEEPDNEAEEADNTEDSDATDAEDQQARVADATDKVDDAKAEESDAADAQEQEGRIHNAVDNVLTGLEADEDQVVEDEEAAKEADNEEDGDDEASSDEEAPAEGTPEPVVDVEKESEEEADDTIYEDEDANEPTPWEEEHLEDEEKEAKELAANALSAAANALSSGTGFDEALILIAHAKAVKILAAEPKAPSKPKGPKRPGPRMTGAEKTKMKRGIKRSEQKNRGKKKFYTSVDQFEKHRGKWRANARFKWNNKGKEISQNIFLSGDQSKPRARIKNNWLWVREALDGGGSFEYPWGKKSEREAEVGKAKNRQDRRKEVKENVDQDAEKRNGLAGRLRDLASKLIGQKKGDLLNSKDIEHGIKNDKGVKNLVNSLHKDTRKVLRTKFQRVLRTAAENLTMEMKAVAKALLGLTARQKAEREEAGQRVQKETKAPPKKAPKEAPKEAPSEEETEPKAAEKPKAPKKRKGPAPKADKPQKPNLQDMEPVAPKAPKEPKRESFDTDEDFQKAWDKFEKKWTSYEEAHTQYEKSHADWVQRAEEAKKLKKKKKKSKDEEPIVVDDADVEPLDEVAE